MPPAQTEGSSNSIIIFRLITNFSGGNSANMGFECAELWDGLNFGGFGIVSFDVKDAFGNFNPLIAGEDIGAISQGEPVVLTIGEVEDDFITKFNYSLPSSQTDFGIRLKVEQGAVTLGVSISRNG